jgi:hypothetical protein
MCSVRAWRRRPAAAEALVRRDVKRNCVCLCHECVICVSLCALVSLSPPLSLCVLACVHTCMHMHVCGVHVTHVLWRRTNVDGHSADAGAMRGFKRSAALLLLLAVSLVCLTEVAEAAKKRKKSKAKGANAGPRNSEESVLILCTKTQCPGHHYILIRLGH